jgi:hypothetical protein
MTRHLILMFCAAIILSSCKTGPRENTYPREDVANTEVKRDSFYRGRQVSRSRSSTTPSPSRSSSTPAPEPQPTPKATPEPTPMSTPQPTPTPQTSAPAKSEETLPYGKPVPGKPGYVTSPFSPDAGYIDVTGFTPGSKARDPYTNKIFRVP